MPRQRKSLIHCFRIPDSDDPATILHEMNTASGNLLSDAVIHTLISSDWNTIPDLVRDAELIIAHARILQTQISPELCAELLEMHRNSPV